MTSEKERTWPQLFCEYFGTILDDEQKALWVSELRQTFGSIDAEWIKSIIRHIGQIPTEDKKWMTLRKFIGYARAYIEEHGSPIVTGTDLGACPLCRNGWITYGGGGCNASSQIECECDAGQRQIAVTRAGSRMSDGLRRVQARVIRERREELKAAGSEGGSD